MIDKAVAKVAFAHAEDLERQLLTRWPHAWTELDRMRAARPAEWPAWCLLPMAGPAGLLQGQPPFPPPPVALMSALYAWRYTRSVYLVEPGLMARLLGQVPDSLTLDAVTGLPEWCVYVAGEDPHHPGGLWIHLEHDVQTGRPELRLLLDLGSQTLPIPVYLDRGSVTEALADFRENALLGGGQANVRGGVLDSAVADFAERLDACVGLAMHLCRPEADVVAVRRPGIRPVKPRRPVRDRTIWAVGYSR